VTDGYKTELVVHTTKPILEPIEILKQHILSEVSNTVVNNHHPWVVVIDSDLTSGTINGDRSKECYECGQPF